MLQKLISVNINFYEAFYFLICNDAVTNSRTNLMTFRANLISKGQIKVFLITYFYFCYIINCI